LAKSKTKIRNEKIEVKHFGIYEANRISQLFSANATPQKLTSNCFFFAHRKNGKSCWEICFESG